MKTRSGRKKVPSPKPPESRKCSKCRKPSVELIAHWGRKPGVTEHFCPKCYKEVSGW